LAQETGQAPFHILNYTACGRGKDIAAMWDGSSTSPARSTAGNYRRVAFVAHALLPGYLSTDLIDARLKELGQNWPGQGESPGFIKWLQFPVVPPSGSGLVPVRVDFYIVPVLAPDFLGASKDGRAYQWSSRVALAAIRGADSEGASLTVGWGAMTKVATSHGRDFLNKDAEGLPPFSSTHGDSGTAALVLETVRLAGFQPGFRVAIIGANGAIGDVVSRSITALRPESILLVGKGDRLGETKNLSRLQELQGRVESCVQSGQRTQVHVHQDKTTACHDHGSNLVIVATTGMELSPSDIPVGAVVLDMTTPAACAPHPEWQGRLVLTSGCGEFEPAVVPRGFGQVAGQRVSDVGMGSRVIWGCTGETIARAASEWWGHVSGAQIPLDEVEWCLKHFPRLGFHPQPALSFGQPTTWSSVREFVRTATSMRGRSRVAPATDVVFSRVAA